MIRRKGMFILSIFFASVVLVLSGRSYAAASRQRYRIDNFFDKDFMAPRNNVVFLMRTIFIKYIYPNRLMKNILTDS